MSDNRHEGRGPSLEQICGEIMNEAHKSELAQVNGYALEETTIEKGGVLRCCLGTVATEYIGQRVSLGAKSKCHHCGEEFTLVHITPGMPTCYRQPVKWPVWKPDWQIKKHNTPASPQQSAQATG